MAEKPPPLDWTEESLRKATKDGHRTSQNIPGSGLPLVDFFCFADLVAELQDMIWRFAACDSRIIELWINRYSYVFEGKIPETPSILFTTAGTRAVTLESYTLVENRVYQRELTPTMLLNQRIAAGLQQGLPNGQAPAATVVGPVGLVAAAPVLPQQPAAMQPPSIPALPSSERPRHRFYINLRYIDLKNVLS